MEENKQSNNQQLTERQDKTSEFCEAIMKVTDWLTGLAKESDCALIICGDGIRLSSRMHGVYYNMLRAIYSVMKSDDRFAELLTEACMMYSNDMIGRRARVKSINNDNKTN